MRVIVLANNWVGLEIVNFLRKDKDVSIVGLGIHDPSRQKFAQQIVAQAGVNKKNIFYGSDFRKEFTIERIKKLKPDIIISAFWGYILKSAVLDIPHLGAINLHPGYLPANRGMNPNVWPFIEGTPAGVTIHYIDEGVDTGDIIARRKVLMTPYDTAETLYEKTLADIVDLFILSWSKIKNGTAPRIKQDTLTDRVTFHYKKDIEALDNIELDKMYTGREIIQLLRARSYSDKFYLSYQDNQDKVYLRIVTSQYSTPYPVSLKSEYQQYIEYVLRSYKEGYRQFPVLGNEITFVPITRQDYGNTLTISRLSRFRRKGANAFPSYFTVTDKRTKIWLRDQLLKKKDRILFFIYLKNGKTPFGHIGLYRFDWVERSCEIDNVIRGGFASNTKGKMTSAVKQLMIWAFEDLQVSYLTLRVFADNHRAVELYNRCGFVVWKRIPQKKIMKENEIFWIDDVKLSLNKAERVLLIMKADSI